MREREYNRCPDPQVALQLDNVTYAELVRDLSPLLQHGGRHVETACTSRDVTAVIIPFRRRTRNLHILLHNLVPFLARQQATFRIIVVEQVTT